MGVKKKISQILLAVGIMAVSGFGASVSLMLISNQRIKLARAETTGMGQISGVQILQAGTGASVTIRGETLNENDYGADNASRRTILNNNVVRYRVNYTASGGWIKLTFTMPVNNYIDTASVSGCDSDETHKSEVKASAVNDKASIVANQAICYINADDGMVSSSWDITTKPWGGNGDTITPSVAVNDGAANVVIDPITVVGRLNYGMAIGYSYGNYGSASGYNKSASLDYSLYVDTTDNEDMLGVEPLKNGSFSFDVDMSNWPSGWQAKLYSNRDGNNLVFPNNSSSGVGKISLSQIDEKTLRVSLDGVATAIRRCASAIYSNSSAVLTNRCYQSMAVIGIWTPLSSLTDTTTAYSFSIKNFLVSDGAMSASVPIDYNSLATNTMWYRLDNLVKGDAQMRIDLSYPPGVANRAQEPPLYAGDTLNLLGVVTSNSSSASDYSTNNLYCVAFSGGDFLLSSAPKVLSYDNGATWYRLGKLSTFSDDSLRNACSLGNVVGDDFYDSFSDAKKLDNAKNFNLVAGFTEKMPAGSVWSVDVLSKIKVKALKNPKEVKRLTLSCGLMVSDDYSSAVNCYQAYWSVPGLLLATITDQGSSTDVGSTGTLMITPVTFNQDSNSKIIVTLPKYLTVVNGSLKTGEYTLKKDTDYALASNDDGTSTVTIDMDKLEANMVAAGKEAHITGEQPTYDSNGIPTAADNGGKGVERTPITLDYQVDAAAVTPATATITVETMGDGTAHASTIARRKTVNVSLTSQPNSIGMTTRTSSGSNNALSLTAKVGGVATGYIDSSVRTNGIEGGYSLTMNADGDASLSDGKHTLSTINEPVAGQNGWSLRLDSTDGTSTGQWRKVPASSSPLTILSSAEATSAASIRSTFGFATSVTQPAGTYTGRVIYTLTSGL